MNNQNNNSLYSSTGDTSNNLVSYLDSYNNYNFKSEYEFIMFLNNINYEFTKNIQKVEHQMWPSYSMNPHENKLSVIQPGTYMYSQPYQHQGQYQQSEYYSTTYNPFNNNYNYTYENNNNYNYNKSLQDDLDSLLDSTIRRKNSIENPFSKKDDANYSENFSDINKNKDNRSPIKKEKKNINVQIETFEDLIRLLDENPYDETVEYNIDLKSLHNIEKELKDINNMVGLKQFKNDLLDQLLYFVQGLHENTESDYKHLVIYGPPGTGKTQIAKLVGQMYSKLGILKNGVFKKVTRSDLIAGYLGQTAIKTSKVIQECLGGVLFIDEVYSLGSGGGGGGSDEAGGGDSTDSYSKECIDTICEALSNYKSNLMVIVAGYERDVQRYFFSMNPGLPSRFIWRFNIQEYNSTELKQIFLNKVKDNGWKLKDETVGKELDNWFTQKHSLGTFKYYGRDMEQLFTYCKIAHGRRIYGLPEEEKRNFVIKDMDKGYDMFMKHADENKKTNDKSFRDKYCGLYL